MKLKTKIILLLLCLFIGIFSTKVNATDEPSYEYWNQLNYYGLSGQCYVVAEAKLLYAAGINRNSDFNPSKWWEYKNEHGVDLIGYASEQGKTLNYIGTTTTIDENSIWENICNGYFTIVQLSKGPGDEHWVLVDNKKSKENEIWVDESGAHYDENYYYCGGNGPRTLESIKSLSGRKLTGRAVIYYAPFTLTVNVNPNGKSQLSWNAIDGATKYVIAR